jgi:NADPH-dependent ferric siderophore reductase
MPTAPKWLGDTMELVLSRQMHPVVVSAVNYLDSIFKRVRFEGDLRGSGFAPGQVVQLRVSDTDYRHYTPSFFDEKNGVCDILFYLHGQGPGSDWARQLAVGQTIRLRGPGGRLRYDAAAKHHFFFGDETAIGLFRCLKDAVNENNQEYLCVLELDEGNRTFPERSDLTAEVVAKSSEIPAFGAIQVLDAISPPDSVFWDVWKHATFYLAGRAQSIQAFRKKLKSFGVSGSQIRTQAYWADGKKGL